MALDELFAGRTLAIDRSALPSLAMTATMRADGASLEQLAQRTDLPMADTRPQRVGSTAVIPLTGLTSNSPVLAFLTGGTMPDALVASLRQAVADPEVRDVLLLVDSPGGETALLTETAAEIRRLRELKPITALARPLMASAALWLASQATDVVATPSADVCSVGIFVLHLDESKRNERDGVMPRLSPLRQKRSKGTRTQPSASPRSNTSNSE